MQEVKQKKEMLASYSNRNFSQNADIVKLFKEIENSYSEAFSSTNEELKEMFILKTRYLSEDLITIHLAFFSKYDILYPIMTLISLIFYFLSNYMEFFLKHSQVSFSHKKPGFVGVPYFLISVAMTIFYFREIR